MYEYHIAQQCDLRQRKGPFDVIFLCRCLQCSMFWLDMNSLNLMCFFIVFQSFGEHTEQMITLNLPNGENFYFFISKYKINNINGVISEDNFAVH